MGSLLDTNVVSQRIKLRPHEGVMAWLRQANREETFLSVVTICEIRTGIELLLDKQKRRDLDSWLLKDIQRGYTGRILPVTEEIADLCGRLVARARKANTTPNINDALIAATAVVHRLTVATLNPKHFVPLGVELVEF